MSFLRPRLKNLNEIATFRAARLLLYTVLGKAIRKHRLAAARQEVRQMKRLSTISILTAAATFALATSSFSGAVPNNGASSRANDATTIAQLQTAAQQALADGRNGGKNNLEYKRKNYEINLLIDRLQSGQQVDPADIDKAMEPVHIW
jgi:hypothetical protein